MENGRILKNRIALTVTVLAVLTFVLALGTNQVSASDMNDFYRVDEEFVIVLLSSLSLNNSLLAHSTK